MPLYALCIFQNLAKNILHNLGMAWLSVFAKLGVNVV